MKLQLKAITALTACLMAIPAMAEAPKGYFQVPGIDTSVQLYGNACFDLVYDAVQPGGVMAGLSGAGNNATTNNASPKSQWDMTMDESRFGMRTVTPTSMGDIKTRFEMDFLGTSKDSDTKTKTPWNNVPWNHPISGESKNLAHVRQMYGEWNGFLFGKAHNNFEDPDGSPNYIDWDGLLGDWYGCGRDLQIRYTTSFNANNTLSVAIERNDGNTINDSMNGLKAANANGTAYSGPSHSLPGDLTARYTFSDKWGHIAVAAAYTKYEQFGILAAGGTKTVSKDAISWALSGHFQFGEDSFVYHLGRGAGQWGAFLQDGAQFNPNGNGEVQIVYAKQLEVGFEHFFTAKLHGNVFGSYVGYDRDNSNGMNGGAFSSYKQAGVNMIYNATRTMQYAVEYINGKAKTFDANTLTGADGSTTSSIGESKLHLQAKFKFN